MIEENEQKEQLIIDLIEKITKDPLPTNIFTTADTDPLVLLGKLNEIIGILEQLRLLINDSDTTAKKALEEARKAVEQASQAVQTAQTLGDNAIAKANEAIATANNALTTAGETIATANSALETANGANTTASEAKTIAEEARTNANSAVTTAGEADTKATNASATAINAKTTADEAKTLADSAKTMADNAISIADGAETTAGEAKTIAEEARTNANNAVITAGEASAKATNASATATNAENTANTALETAQNALEQVTQGLGTKVYNNSGQLMNSAKFKGENGINVDMNEADPETFDIRLDNTITEKLTSHDNMLSDIDSDVAELTSITTEQAEKMKEVQNIATSAETVATSAYTLAGQAKDKDIEQDKILARTLLTPLTAPTSEELVSIGTNNAQKSVNIGEGLILSQGTLKNAMLATIINNRKLSNALKDLLLGNNLIYNHAAYTYPKSDYLKITTLFFGSAGSGSITLYEPILIGKSDRIEDITSNFDAIMVVSVSDAGNGYVASIIPIWEFIRVYIASDTYKNIAMVISSNYWTFLSADLKKTTIRTGSENCILKEIYGIKIVAPTSV